MQKSQMKKASLSVGIITALLIANILTISFSITTSFQSAHGASRNTTMKYPQPRTSMALSGNNIYLTWWDNKTGNNEVFFASSTDNGKTFDTPINLSNAKGASADSQIATSQNNVYVTWWDNKTGVWEVFSRASTDGGRTFADEIMLKSVGTSPLKKLDGPTPQTIFLDTLVAASGSNEYVLWWDNKTGNSEVIFARSTDMGKTFADPINISNSPDARSVGARITADPQGNNVYISWIDIDENTGQKQVLFRASNDNGQSFGNAVIVNK
jgi:hypothetical protein